MIEAVIKLIDLTTEVDHRNSYTIKTLFKYSDSSFVEPAEIVSRNSRGELVFKIRRNFDQQGRIVRETSFEANDSTKVESVTIYWYSDDGRTMTKRVFIHDELVMQLEVKFDLDNRQIEIIETESAFKRLQHFIYTDSSRIRNEWIINGDRKMKVIEEESDLTGNLTKSNSYSDVDTSISQSHHFKYFYNGDGKLQRSEEYMNGVLREERLFLYEYY